MTTTGRVLALACLACPNGVLVNQIVVYTEGDQQGVRLTMTKGGRRWELTLDPSTAGRLLFRLHGAVLDASQADDGRVLQRRCP